MAHVFWMALKQVQALNSASENFLVAAVAREKMVTLKDVAVVPGDLTEEAMDTS